MSDDAGTIGLSPNLRAHVYDVPPMTDPQAGKAGLLCGLATTSPDDTFPGGAIFESNDDGVTYEPLESFVGEAIVGSVDGTAPGGVTGRFWDTVSVLRVIFDKNVEISSEPDEVVASGKANWIVVGKEIIAFATATLVATRTYELTRLLRGRRNTEKWIEDHAENESVMLITPPSSVRFVETGVSALGTNRKYKAVPNGLTTDDVTSEISVLNLGESLQEFSPEIAPSIRNSDGDVTIEVIPRTRAPMRMLSGAVPPNYGCGCDWEISIEIWNSTRTTLITTICLLGRTRFIYTVEQQIEDFGSPQAVIKIAVFSRGKIVGRGRATLGEV